MHAEELEAPATGRYVPGGQYASQNPCPLTPWYVPGEHRRHEERPAMGLKEPGGQGRAGDAPGQKAPMGQGVEAMVAIDPAPVALLNWYASFPPVADVV
jgi:hypothetical protein